MKQTSNSPTSKTWAGALAGAVTLIIVWAVKTWGHVDIPPEIAIAISTVLSFFTSWITPPGQNDDIRPDPRSEYDV